MEKLMDIFSYFFIYSILGWICEIIWTSFEEKKFIKDRGFLFGPYCPIYGIGGLFIIYLLADYSDDVFALFLISMIVCSILEYITGWILEKLFSERWWDYSDMKFNIEGRVCLLNSLAFGVLSVLLVYYIHPFFTHILNIMPHTLHIILFVIVFLIFIIDLIATLNGVLKLRKLMKNIKNKKTRNFIFKIGMRKYSEDLANKLSKFHYLNIRNILKRFPRLFEPNDKDIAYVLKNIFKKKK